MDLTPVDSSFIEAVGYDNTENILHIKFRGRDEAHKHYGVPVEVYELMLSAESTGSFYTKNIKGKYKEPVAEDAKEGS